MSADYPSGQAALMSFFKFQGKNRLWAIRQVFSMSSRFKKEKGILFYNTLGAGIGLGFSSYPEFNQWALLTVWPSMEDAVAFYWNSDIMDDYRLKSFEDFTVLLRPVRSRGKWPGVGVFEPQPKLSMDYPAALLTRTPFRFRFLIPYWFRVIDVDRITVDEPGLFFRKGVGERPWGRQYTFSIWDNMDSADLFTYGEEIKRSAELKKSSESGDNKEELYARFQVVGHRGTQKGMNPLKKVSPPSLL